MTTGLALGIGGLIVLGLIVAVLLWIRSRL